MTYLTSETGSVSRVHNHPSDKNCHWSSVFKPLAFIASHQDQFMKGIADQYFKGVVPDMARYTLWLVDSDRDGMLNLVNILIRAFTTRGVPSS